MIRNKDVANTETCQYMACGYRESPRYYDCYINDFGLEIRLVSEYHSYKIFIDEILVAESGWTKIKFIHNTPKEVKEYVISELENIMSQKSRFDLDTELLIEKFKQKKGDI